jgi:uncharacterized protein (TIGR00255 family)
VLQLPDLFTVEARLAAPDKHKEVLNTVRDAVKRVVWMRQREGQSLSRDLRRRAIRIQRAIDKIAGLAARASSTYRDRLLKRAKAISEQFQLEPNRLTQEVALLAERSDVTEEIIRARHHLNFFLSTMASKEEVGKKLDFIVQEIHREVNTIASKAQDFQASKEVVGMKSELEKMREQIQNVV